MNPYKKAIIAILLSISSTSAFAFPILAAGITSYLPLILATIGIAITFDKLKASLFAVSMLSIFLLLSNNLNSLENTNSLEYSLDIKDYHGLDKKRAYTSNNLNEINNFKFKEVLFLKNSSDNTLNGFPYITKESKIEVKEDTAYIIVDWTRDINTLQKIYTNNKDVTVENTFIVDFFHAPRNVNFYRNELKKANDIQVNYKNSIRHLSSENSTAQNYNKKINIIAIAGIKETIDISSPNFHSVTLEQIMYEDHAFWDSLENKIDKNKPTIFVVNNPPHIKDSNAVISKILAAKLNLDSVNFTDNRFNKFETLDDYSSATQIFPNMDRFISPIRLQALYRAEKKIKIVCVSSECASNFPNDSLVSSEIPNHNWYDQGLKIDGEIIDKYFSKDYSYVFATGNSIEMLASRFLGEMLYNEGYDIEGFTNHYSGYFKNIYLDPGDGYLSTITFDNTQSNHYVAAYSLFDSITPDSKAYLDLDETIIIIVTIALLTILTKGRKLGIILPISSLFVIMNWESYFVSSTEMYNTYLLDDKHYYMALMSLAIALSFKSKIKFLLILGCLVLPLPNSITLNLCSIYLLVMCLPDLARIMRNKFLKIRYNLVHAKDCHPEFGSKANETIPFIENNNYGYIASYNSKIPKFFFKANSDYLIRSNHKTFSENEEAGIYESYICNGKNIREILDKAIKSTLESGVTESKIQFWIQKYEFCDTYGVASSHSLDCEGKISISLSEHGLVTDGIESEVIAIDRFEKQNKLLTNIKKAIEKVENKTGKPCNIEFGIKRNKVIIFQVRIQDEYYSHDKLNCVLIRESKSRSVTILENQNYSPLGRSVLVNLYQGRVFFSSNNTYILKLNNHSTKNSQVVFDDTLTKIELFIENIRHTSSHLTISKYIKNANLILSDLLELDTSKGIYLNDTEKENYCNASKIILNRESILSDDLDISSKRLSTKNVSKDIDTSSLTQRDLVHIYVSVLLNSLSDLIDSKEVSNHSDLSISSIESGVTITTKKLSEHTSSRDKIVVHGDFNGSRVGIDEFLKMSPEDKKLSILVADSIPSAMISTAFESKAIILKNGNELSHIAITAIAKKHPLIFSRG